MISILQKIEITDRGEIQYLTHTYDANDITHLIPHAKTELLSEFELKAIYETKPHACTNFSVRNGNVMLGQDIPHTHLPSSMVQIPRDYLDDVWNFLYKLSQTAGYIIVTRLNYDKTSEPRYANDKFVDDEACYLVPTKRMTYSQSHANCSVYFLVNGKTYDEDTETYTKGKRWSTHKIISNNEVLQRYMVLLMDDTGLNHLKANSNIKITSFKLTEAYNLPLDKLEIDRLALANGLNYAVVDLASLPLVNHNTSIVSNTHMIYSAVERFNISSMQNKVMTAFIKELVAMHPDLMEYNNKDEVYTEKNIVPDRTPYNGVKFSIIGSKSIPSVNECIKSLKIEGLNNMHDMITLADEHLDMVEMNIPMLNVLKQNCIKTILHLRSEYKATKNPMVCYQNADQINKLFIAQKELCKARLTYIRSSYMTYMDNTLFEKGQTYSNAVGDGYLSIQFGKFS